MKNLKKCLLTINHSNYGSAALLLLRLVAGLAFIFHGWGKIQSPMGWMGPEAPVPGIFQALAAISEFGGGICWILGLLTPIASAGILCTMVVAVSMHKFVMGDPFVSMGGSSYELAAAYLCIAVVLLAMGPGKFSADTKIFGNRH